MESRNRVHGTLAAAVTPLTGVDGSIDGDGIAAVVDFYARAGLDGILALGTTGEGILFSLDERRFAADEFVTSAHHRLAVVVHCGAQTTHDTVVLAEHAASHDAAGVAVIPPPYFALDAEAIWRHLDAAAHACAPLPFYIYEFAARSGYAVPIDVVERLRSTAPNLAGLKVSDSPFESVRPYLLPGLDVFIGAEGLIAPGHGVGSGRSGLRARRGAPGADHRRGRVPHPGGERSSGARAVDDRAVSVPVCVEVHPAASRRRDRGRGPTAAANVERRAARGAAAQ